MSDLVSMLRRPAQMLCVTAGQQPYGGLQPTFQHEQTGPDWLDPVFLDAPCFTGAGGGLRHNDTALCAIAILEDRL